VFEEGADFITPLKVGQNMLPGNKIAPDCGAAVEEIGYGGRLRTYDNTAKPYRQALKITLRPFLTVPPGPGNYAVYALDDNYVRDRVAALRAYLAVKDAAFPGLHVPEVARSRYLEGHQAKSAEAAMQRIVGQKSKRSALDSGAESDLDKDAVDPDYEALVQCGIAFTHKQAIAMSKGYKI
jgi:hypothetical protein